MKVYGVVFNDNGKVYYFKSNDLVIHNNVCVIVETEKGLQYGKVVLEVPEEKLNNYKDELKSIIRLTTKEDYLQYMKNLKEAEEALKDARRISKELGLEMNFLSATFTFDKKQLLYNFTALERIDFRELARKLANIYKTRIELRQIGARDKAALVGGIGTCGKELCCKQFLKNLESVSINMAKNQNLALNPSKINGNCGRLLCCLNYEDDVYIEAQKGLPSIGETITKDGTKGEVVAVDVLRRKVKVAHDNDFIELDYNDESN